MAMMMMERPRTRFYPLQQVERKQEPAITMTWSTIRISGVRNKLEFIFVQKQATEKKLKEAQVQLELGLALKKKLKVEGPTPDVTTEDDENFQERLREIDNMIGDAMSEISKAEVAMQQWNSKEAELKRELETLEVKDELEKNEKERMDVLGLGTSFGCQDSDQQVKESSSLLENEITQSIQMPLNGSHAPVITKQPTRIRMPPPPPKNLQLVQEVSPPAGNNSAGERPSYPSLSVPVTLIELSPMTTEDGSDDGSKSTAKNMANADNGKSNWTCSICQGIWEGFVACMISLCGEC